MKSSKTKAYRCVTVILSAILVVASMSMTGCSFQSLIPSQSNQDGNTVIQPGNTDDSSAPGNSTGTGEQEPPENKPVLPTYYNPLTGLGTETDLSMTRPVAISLGYNNAPIYGIARAEILIEAPVENGETRTVMITTHYTDLKQIGTIGTTRSYLLALADDFGAVSVCAAANDIRPGITYPAYPTMNYEADGATTVFYQVKDTETADNLYTSGTRLIGALENFEKTGATLPYLLMAYGTSTTPITKKATGVIIPYSNDHITQFLYDANQHQYFRCSNTAAHTDAATGEQISFSNILLLTCESSIHNKVTGTEFDLNIQDGGTGCYITEGYSMEITWSRGEDGQLTLKDTDGNVLQLNRGKTYIGLIDLANDHSVLIVE